MKVGWKFPTLLACMLVAILGFYWFAIGDYRAMCTKVNTLTANVAVMQKHINESDRILTAMKTLAQEVKNARVQSDSDLADACRVSGDERYDKLMRLLEADFSRRYGDSAPCGINGSVPGTGGVRGSARAPASGKH